MLAEANDVSSGLRRDAERRLASAPPRHQMLSEAFGPENAARAELVAGTPRVETPQGGMQPAHQFGIGSIADQQLVVIQISPPSDRILLPVAFAREMTKLLAAHCHAVAPHAETYMERANQILGDAAAVLTDEQVARLVAALATALIEAEASGRLQERIELTPEAAKAPPRALVHIQSPEEGGRR